MRRLNPFLLIASAGVFLACTFYYAVYSPADSADLASVRKKVAPALNSALEKQGLQLGNAIYIRIFKESNELELWIHNGNQYSLFKTYPICKYSGELGPKLKEGDRQSPEGFYFVTPAQMNPNSSYHLSFNLGYPNAYDRAHGRTGSYLMVHGNCVSIGCYAMTNAGIEEIYLLADAAFNNGQSFFRAHIFPFRLTEANLKNHSDSKWLDFWKNLKEGYDYFEKHHIPPNIEVNEKRYIVE